MTEYDQREALIPRFSDKTEKWDMERQQKIAADVEQQGAFYPERQVNKQTMVPLRDVLTLATADHAGLVKAAESYGDSWKARGGVGAFMMLARKWDRLENQVKKFNYDIFQAIAADNRPEGIIDDIRDLRRYLLLVDAHMLKGTLRGGG